MSSRSKTLIEKEVDRQFRQLSACRGDPCTNPVTGGQFIFGMRGEDSIAWQKRKACRALVAREWHASGSPTAPPLVVNEWAIEEARHGGGLSHLLGYFARSLKSNNWFIAGHPPFEIYARGVLASPECPSILKEDRELVERFPPQPIHGLEPGLLYVRPTKPLPRWASRAQLRGN
jgi:hypothetical protein